MKTYLIGIVPTIFSFIRGYYTNSLLIGTVVLTSTNYWRNPQKGFRRNLDMFCVFSIGVYNMWRMPCVWCIITPLCFILWCVSNYFEKLWIHSFIHIIPSVAYIIWS